MKTKKIAAIVGLLIVIAAALVFVFKQSGIGVRGPKEPDWMLEQPTEKADLFTGEVMTRQKQEWDALGQKGGAYKNPDTGRYTMVGLDLCIGCGAKVPSLSAPPGVQPPAPGAAGEWLPTEKCPKCGKQML